VDRDYADALGRSAERNNYDVTVKARLATWVIAARDKETAAQYVAVVSQDPDGALRVTAHLRGSDERGLRHELGAYRIGDWVDPNDVWRWIFDADYERLQREWRAGILDKP
jgi:hypothetical protein